MFLIILFLLSLSFGYIFKNSLIKQQGTKNSHVVVTGNEINRIKNTKSIKEQEKIYIKLMDRVGPEKAQEDLQHSGIPYIGNTHLLNHAAGNYIWNKYGPAGITKCKDYFSSSCYHGFIIRGIGNGKTDNIDLMLKKCKKKGREAYSQCAHAMGHGFLAYLGYANLLDALHMCDDTSKRISDFVVSFCHNGVFMENIWGLHEGRPSPDRWVKETDPIYPCDDPRIGEVYLPECWYNQAQQMSILSKDNLKVANVCNSLGETKSAYMCFDGLYRGFNNDTKDNIPLKYKMCNQMPVKWFNKCISTQASASFQQGDNELPLKICAYSDSQSVQEDCYRVLYGMTFNYESRAGRVKFCEKIPIEYRGECIY